MGKNESIFGGLLIGLGLAAVGVIAFLGSGKKLSDINLDDIFKLPPIGGNTGGNTNTGGGDSSGSCSFAAAGDFGSGRNSNWKKTVAIAVGKVAHFIGLGDYSYTDEDDFVPVVAELSKGGVKFKGAEGNHDGSGYAKIFIDQPSMQYAFDCGPARIILLNTKSSASSNASFAEKELKATKKAWKVFAFHKCMYTNSSDHGEEGGLKSALDPIIKKYGVQLVLYAHNHNYQRFQFTDHKTMYVCVGTGGESHYDIKGSKTGTKYTNDTDFGALIVNISGSTMTGSFITHGGATKDSFSLSQSDFAANQAVAYMSQRISA